jgi:ATP-binding cassette subfamily G (WHITE) protein 2 (PDR)
VATTNDYKMYRVSPFTYWIGGMVSTLLHDRPVYCSSTETSHFDPPAGQTCQQYLSTYLQTAAGTLQNPNASNNCQYCPLSSSDQFLAGSKIYYNERWRNFGIMFAFIGFNIAMAVLSYWAFRVAKWDLSKVKSLGGKKGAKAGKKVRETAMEGAAPPNREA